MTGERIWPSAWMGLTMPPITMRAIWEKMVRAHTEAVGEEGVDGEEEEAEAETAGSSGTTQSRTESTRGTRAWKRREAREQWPSA